MIDLNNSGCTYCTYYIIIYYIIYPSKIPIQSNPPQYYIQNIIPDLDGVYELYDCDCDCDCVGRLHDISISNRTNNNNQKMG